MTTELDEIGPGSLKLIVAMDDPAVESTLRAHVPEQHIRRAGNAAWVIFTAADPPTIRDWLTATLQDPAMVFVAEFEHWSGYGNIDQAWLLRRGH